MIRRFFKTLTCFIAFAVAALAAIEPIAVRHRLVLIEDSAQAHGARHQGKVVGGLARAAAFSFYPTKNLGAMGDGGAITTDDDALADRVRLLQSYGWRTRSVSEVLGVNTRLDELQAALLRVKLARLDEWNDLRGKLAARYLEGLAGPEGVRLPHVPAWVEPVWHQFVVGVEDRPTVQRALAGAGVETLVHYDPLPHLTPAYRDLGWSPGRLPRAERLATRALSLPMYPQLQLRDCDRVIEALSAALSQTAGR